jgi:protein SCO1/2
MRWSVVWIYGALGIAGLMVGAVVLYEHWHVPAPASSEPLWPRLQAYKLYDEEGALANLTPLQGRVVLLAFIYTRCPTVCPRLSASMRTLLEGLPQGVRVTALSISLDPDRDTGATLAAYAQTYQVSGHAWHYWRPESQAHAFLLARDVFGITAATLPGNGEILHNDAFFLVDCSGRLRGLYTSTALELAQHHLQKLIQLCETSSS